MIEVQTIINLWNDGLTATEIGDQIGKTRSAVLGKINRLRAKGVLLERRVAERDKTVKTRGRGNGKPRKAINQLSFDAFFASDAVVQEPEPQPACEGINLFDLKSNQCHYIIGRSDEMAMYCGAPTHRRSMCKTHYALCYYKLKT